MISYCKTSTTIFIFSEFSLGFQFLSALGEEMLAVQLHVSSKNVYVLHTVVCQ